ncbi:Rid family detoxifying hydrolase [Pseudarthrobacter sp. B4EP4b]|uniref:Rid family detoxifying hydrolase n=1 Tax=Pseudarthrobacter sp. B4EP4b TaxID=2590664 RepID=UPI0021050F91|nr:Rid family detoxifying hydrolase [Pseudarthrobacter sp. B4EP4b]
MKAPTPVLDAINRLSTSAAPQAAGPYSQSTYHAGILYVSGQLPIDPSTGEVVEPGDAKAQTHQVIANLSAILDAAGASLQNVLKATVFLRRIEDFAAVNNVYASYFGTILPSRSCVAVSSLPDSQALVEIEVVAAVSDLKKDI